MEVDARRKGQPPSDKRDKLRVDHFGARNRYILSTITTMLHMLSNQVKQFEDCCLFDYRIQDRISQSSA